MVRLPAKERAAFSASEESSTHALAYTGVPVRPFGEVPKTSKTRKEAIAGYSLEPRSEKIKAWTSKDEPIIFNDLKTVHLCAAIYRDLDIDCVIDMAVDSGTAAIAAALVGCAYDGICHNVEHENFATEVFERALVAMLTDATGKPGVTSTRGQTRSKLPHRQRGARRERSHGSVVVRVIGPIAPKGSQIKPSTVRKLSAPTWLPKRS